MNQQRRIYDKRHSTAVEPEKPTWDPLEALDGDERQLAMAIAERLEETDVTPRRMLADLVRVAGIDFAQNVLGKTIEIEARGGMLTKEGDRRRTIGGVFFHLAREQLSDDEEKRRAVFNARWLKRKEYGMELPEFEITKRRHVFQHLAQDSGSIRDCTVRLIGRPQNPVIGDEEVILEMSHEARNASAPRGIPEPHGQDARHLVIMRRDEWEEVEAALEKEPERWLSISGRWSFDEDKRIVVSADKITTQKRSTDSDEDPEDV